VTHPTPPRLFFAGTDTDIGKTYVAALAARLLSQSCRVGVYKPVASGCQIEGDQRIADDAVKLWEAAGRPRKLDDVCPQRFIAPLAPPEAAAKEGRTVDSTRFQRDADDWSEHCDRLIVEGAGGLFSPLADGVLNIDVAIALQAKLIIVAANRLGVIHQTLVTCEAAIHRGLDPAGIILSDPLGQPDESVAGNQAQIERYTRIPILGVVSHQADESSLQGLTSIL